MSQRKVLIVAEQPTVMWGLQSACREAGFAVIVSPDGLHAAIRATQDPPDFILLDAAIGGIDPVQLCELFAKDRRTSAVKILLLIDSSQSQSVQRCRSLGVRIVAKQNDYLQSAAKMLGNMATDRFGIGWAQGKSSGRKNGCAQTAGARV